MDEGTVRAFVDLAAVTLPFVVAGIVYLQKRLSKIKEDLNISNEQGDLIIALARAVYAPIRAKYANDPSKVAILNEAEKIISDMAATWEDETGTTAYLESRLDDLRKVLAGL